MNDINIKKLQQHKDLLKHLEMNMGYILPDILDEMLDVFGDDFNVVLKPYTGDRQFISLRDLINLEQTNIDLYDDIREIFICSDDYNYIFKTN